jgi:hypothetical protein
VRTKEVKDPKDTEMIPKVHPTPPGKLNEGQVANEIVNDSLGTVDPADTADTDPKDDPETQVDSDPSSGIED